MTGVVRRMGHCSTGTYQAFWTSLGRTAEYLSPENMEKSIVYKILTIMFLIMMPETLALAEEYPHSFFHASQQGNNKVETYHIFIWANPKATEGTIFKATRMNFKEWGLKAGVVNASCLDEGIDQFTIEWNNGEKEVGRYHLGKYKILSHSSDELAIGTTQKWEHQSVPFDLKLKMKVWMSIHEVKPLPKTRSRKRKSFQILRLQDPSVKKNL